jgi:hypothetical protein
LKKNERKPWLKESWCFPQATADFVCAMEDVLQVYCRPYDGRYPVICLDEMLKNLLADKRKPTAMKPGQARREDYTYDKKGSANIFVACEPLVGTRVLQVTHQRTKKDFAYFIRDVLEKEYPNAEKVVLVMDNLNTHKASSLYDAFPAAEARALLDRLEIHYTPKHASWLNMAEIEFSTLVRQGLQHNISTREALLEQVEQWQNRRNRCGIVVHWQCTTADARVKLARLYPVFEEKDSVEKSDGKNLQDDQSA